MEEHDMSGFDSNPPKNYPYNHLHNNPQSQESFRQNFSSAEKILPFQGIFPPPCDDHDIRTFTREKVEELLYAKQLSETESTMESLDPLSINQWIWENRVKKEIVPDLLRECLRDLNHCPVRYFKKFSELLTLQRIVARIHQVELSQIREEHLINPNTIRSAIEQMGITVVKKSLFDFLMKRSIQEGSLQSHIPLMWTPKEKVNMHPRILNFQQHMQHKGFSKKHTQNCVTYINQLFKWLCKNIRIFMKYQPDDIPVIQIGNEHLLAYRTYRLKLVKDGSYSPITFTHAIFAIRSFYYFLQERYGYSPPLQRFRAIKAPRYHSRDTPTEQQIEVFFQVVARYSKQPNRDQIGYRLLLQLGLRLSEAAQVTWGDINLGTRTLRIHSKGNRSHILPLAGKLLHMIQQAWNGQPSSEYVLGKKPRSTVNQLYEYYKLYSMIAGWTFPGGVHLFRHVFITRLAKKGALPQPLKDVARVVNLDTVSLYIQLAHQNQYLTQQINMLNYSLSKGDV